MACALLLLLLLLLASALLRRLLRRLRNLERVVTWLRAYRLVLVLVLLLLLLLLRLLLLLLRGVRELESVWSLVRADRCKGILVGGSRRRKEHRRSLVACHCTATSIRQHT